MDTARLANLVLRVGVAFAFLYPPLSAISDPSSWLGYFPPAVLALGHSLGLSDLVMLHVFGVVEGIVALWLLSGWRIRVPALLACVMLLSIVIFNGPQFPVLFRDLAIAAVALSLALSAKPS